MDIELKIQSKKLELIQWLSSLEDLNTINKIVELKSSEDNDWWNSITNEERLAIESGLADAGNGKLNPHSKARALYEKWL
ncbi:MAG: hypothetical protein V4546_15065 [Bacteroidota bacterium]